MAFDSAEDADYEFEAASGDESSRLDSLVSRYLSQKSELEQGQLQETGIVPSRSKTAQWIQQGWVQVNYKTVIKPAFHPAAGDLISIRVPPARELTLEADSKVLLDIVFEDEHLLVLNKPAGMVVHPGAGQESGTLVQGLLAYLGDNLRRVGDAFRPGLVHRLDKDTSGLMLVAKTELAYQGLLQQFLPPRSIKRTYLALTAELPRSADGRPAVQDHGSILLALGRHPVERKKIAVLKTGGKEAHTDWQVAERLAQGYLLMLTLHTGRTHQIRVHLQQTGAAVLGDPIYGKPPSSFPVSLRQAVAAFGRQALHASRLSFVHPENGELMEFEAPLPQDMQKLLELLRKG